MTTSAEICPDAEATRAHAARSLAHLPPGTILRLHGPLGAGKSEWVRGLASALGIPGQVPSPTFTLCQPLRGGRLPLDHWDLYRLEQARLQPENARASTELSAAWSNLANAQIRNGEAERAIAVIKRTMEGAAEPAVALTVPLVVEARAAGNWDEAH